MIQVAIFEDHPIVLRSLTSVIKDEPNFNFKFGVTTKVDLYKSLVEFKNLDVLILDFLAVDVTGMELYEHVQKNFPDVKMISFTSLSSPILVENLLANGVKAYVNKNQDIDDLLKAINEVYEGRICLPDDYKFLASKINTLKKNTLTPREIEMVQLISKEYTTNDIATQYGISINTVENHRKNIFAKLNVKNVAGLVREASSLGYLEI
jgi:DNA-binding NarL/FixJ family response regulator